MTARHDPFDIACLHEFLRALPQLAVYLDALDIGAVERSLEPATVVADEELGQLRRYASPWGELYVSARRHVVRFLSKPTKRGEPEIDLEAAAEVADRFRRAVTADASSRNFEASTPTERFDLFEFSWTERRRPGECSIYPNLTVVKVAPRKGYVAIYQASDVRSYRAHAPAISPDRAREIVTGRFASQPSGIETIELTERSEHGGLRTRTVYDTRVMVGTGGEPTGVEVHAVVVDAETGDVIEHVR